MNGLSASESKGKEHVRRRVNGEAVKNLLVGVMGDMCWILSNLSDYLGDSCGHVREAGFGDASGHDAITQDGPYTLFPQLQSPCE